MCGIYRAAPGGGGCYVGMRFGGVVDGGSCGMGSCVRTMDGDLPYY
jgi:hypothetical protein